MIKKVLSAVLVFALLLGSVPAVFAADDAAIEAYHTDIAYGTPKIDGEIDAVWDKTNYNIMEKTVGENKDFYAGWFKALWDDEALYVLGKIYGENFSDEPEAVYEHDSLEVLVDENYNRSTKYEEDDYQIRSNFKGFVSTSNYKAEDVTSVGKTFDGYYIVEMKIPFKTITPEEGHTIGFDTMVNTSPTTFFPRMMYVWSPSSRGGNGYANTNVFGSATLKADVDVKAFNEPKYQMAGSDIHFRGIETAAAEYESVTGVTVKFDNDTHTNVELIHSTDYPLISIKKLAQIIGGSVTGGDTLKKDKVTIKFTEGDRIAHYTHADYPNRADYLTTYYTNTSNVMSGTGSNTVAKIAETPIAGSSAIEDLGENYENDGTDGANDGYILERAPVENDGELFVPLYCIVPTLNYNVEYDRFGTPPTVTITTGNQYPSEDTFKVYYAKDYGAVGDGVTDDRAAILKATHAAAMSGEPSKLVLEANKTYLVSERIDATPFFDFVGVENFIFEGNGSTILFDRPLNNAMYLRACKNVKFRNVTFLYNEHTGSHGVITEVNEDEGWFKMEIPTTASMPAPSTWVSAIGDDYGFGQVYDLEEKHLKFIPYDNYNIEGFELLGGREVKAYCAALKSRKRKTGQRYMEVGDGFVFKRQNLTYDMARTAKDSKTAGISLLLCRDIEFDGVVLAGAIELGMSVGLCEGKITLRNYQMRTKDGQLTASAADGVHYWRNRSTLLMENCELWNNIDDHVNTKGELSTITAISDDRKTVTCDYEQNWQSGDEVLFFYRQNNNTQLGSAYITAVDKTSQSGKYILSLDREAPETVQVGTNYKVYNNMAAGYGTCIRGSRFLQSRRHGYIARSRNVIFMNNYVQNNGGSTVAAEDEIGTSEGPFPQSFTIRNNRTYGDGITENSHVLAPIQVRMFNSTKDSVASLDGVLIQGNIIQLKTHKYSFYLNGIKNLYMKNNKILWNDKWDTTEDFSGYKPVFVSNCSVAEFDGLTYDTPIEVSQVVHFAACDVDEAQVKNITVRSGNSSKATLFEQCN